ncbi:MAG: Hsp70 family protein, partial [Desulfobacterales bacterium]
MSDAKFIVGIDLGTTNSILAYTEAESEAREAPDIHILEISQLIGPGAVAAREMLPSFIYMPGEKDIASDA